MNCVTRLTASLLGLVVGSLFVLSFADGQDSPFGGKGKKEKRDKGAKDGWDPEVKAIFKTATKALKSGQWSEERELKSAEKAFRQLDCDGSGFLEPSEWTESLASLVRRVDANGDGRIEFEEYHRYFEKRVSLAIETVPLPEPKRDKFEKRDFALTPQPQQMKNRKEPQDSPGASKSVATRYGKLPPGLPGWFETLDTDHDGQIALHEWRKGGFPLDEFEAMDLDHDGSLTAAEWLRFDRERKRTLSTEPEVPTVEKK